MNPREAEGVRTEAAAPVLARIRTELAQAGPRVRPVLEYIASHLFDPQLQYSRMCSKLGIRDHNRAKLFQRSIGVTPARYIRDCRFEVAIELLRRTPLEVGQIGSLIGIPSVVVFTTAFKRWAGVPPTWYRKHAHGNARSEGEKLVPRQRLASSPAMWRRLASNALSNEESTELLAHLLGTYPEAREWMVARLFDSGLTTRPPLTDVVLGRAELERVIARAAWDDLAELGPEAQKERLRSYSVFRTAALVDLLVEKSLELGRQDAERGIQIARLALEAAVLLERAGADDGSAPTTALAWMSLGNAKRIAGDFAAAERAFAAAESRLPAVAAEPLSMAELLRLRAALWLDEGRLEDAVDLSTRALSLLRAVSHAEAKPIAKALIVRGQACCELERFDDAATDFGEALGLLEATPYVHLRWAAGYALARCYFEQGDSARAEAALASAQRTLASVPGVVEPSIPLWLEARIAGEQGRLSEAAKRLELVIDSLQSRGIHAQVAVALLDLAMLRAQQQLPDQAVKLAAEALCALQACGAVQEAHVARQLITEVLEAPSTAKVLEARTALVAALREVQPTAARWLVR